MTDFSQNKDLPRGLRQNNLGNIRPSTKYQWNGQIGIKDNYVVFSDVEHGIRAMAKDLLSKIKRGLDTLDKYIPVYSPDGDGANDQNAYINAMVKSTGFKPDTILSPDYYTLTKLVKGHIGVENGSKYAALVPEEAINLGVTMALT